jgi:hypothetical protein
MRWVAGYSGTPLPVKLGLKAGQRVALSAAPNGFDGALGPLPADARVVGRGAFDIGVFFVGSPRELEAALAKAHPRLDPAGALWIAWPKKASCIPTDVTENVVRTAALARGLVDVKVCAIDETWSGLKLVVRVRDRPAAAKASARAAPARSGARKRRR